MTWRSQLNLGKWKYITPYALIIGLGLAIAGCDNSSFSGDGAKKSPPQRPKSQAAEDNNDENSETNTAYSEEEIDVSNPDFSGNDAGDPDFSGADSDTPGIDWDGESPGPGDPVTPGFDYEDAPFSKKVEEALGELSENQVKKASLTETYDIKSQDQFWIVTKKGYAYQYTLVGDKIFETKKWTFPFYGTGSRTYVTEGGFVFSNNGGRLWFIDPLKTPQGELDNTPGGKNHWVLPGLGDKDRSCVFSFLRGEKRYLGIGHGAGKYSELELENKPPYKPIWKVVATAQVDASKWGYSCHIDHKRMIYYGAWASGKIYALDLRTLKEVDASTASPNGNFLASRFPKESKGTGSGGSYALSGDRKGHIYNGEEFYTFTHDSTSQLTFGSRDESLYIYPESCLTTDSACAANDRKIFNLEEMVGGGVGPMASLVSGGVIGVNRGDRDIYLIRPKNKKDLDTGIDVKRIAQVEGDPYMYTDFTGSTLYLQNGDLIFDLRKSENFDDKLAVRGLLFSWSSESNETKSWGDAKLQIRCYNSGRIPSQFSTIQTIPKAGKKVHIEAGSCRNKDVNQVEVKVTQMNGGNFIQDIKEIHISYLQ